MVTPQSAELTNMLQPLRVQRYLTSSHNPLMGPVSGWAEQVRDRRRPVDGNNPFRLFERTFADMITQSWDGIRDLQDMWIETTFHWLYSSPHAKSIGERKSTRISDAPPEDLRSLVEVQEALDRMHDGGFAEGVVRMLIFLARSRGEVRRSRLERSNRILEQTEPFASMKPKHRTRLIHRESLIVAFEPELALETLAGMFHDDEERDRALQICREIAGPEDEMSSETIEMMDKLEQLLHNNLESPEDLVRAVAQIGGKESSSSGESPAAA
jgi:hypothetical protein